MKRKTVVSLSSIIIIILIIIVGFSYYIGNQVFLNSTQLTTSESTKEIVGVSRKHAKYYYMISSDYIIENINLKSSYDGHNIPADYIYSSKPSDKNNKTIIMVHGLGGNRYSLYVIAQYFLEKGFNVITYDQRSSNENTAKYTTFGYLEKYDLIDYINYVKKQAPHKVLGIWGTSCGGATAGLAAGHEETYEKLDFLFLDCPVSSMEWMIENEINKMGIGIPTSYMIFCGNIINKLKLGFFYGDADVTNKIKNITTPTLIINSKKDTTTPYFMGKNIYDCINLNNKEIWTVNDSEHTQIWFEHNNEYKNKIDTFLNKYL
ncbi:alpha/beta hydrolase [Anaerofustis stercorihominis]|uniref:alpha/beta hydrolase n=1 Tax=Anaerofustis stercorihominis TaxID=214853 RepID=UPI00214C9227|nr:alpha/beta fold hydrolase [Anaerofustis stercorihominis]MCR2032454.1 alpha/beta fold hydrolase [Anaerofustis stercorihominis]